MKQFVIEHLPRNPATYQVTSLDFEEAKEWIQQPGCHSLVRTTELIAAIQAGMGIELMQSDAAMSLHPGDQALLVSLSFSVLLALTEGEITPLAEDWRCSLLVVERPAEAKPRRVIADVSEDMLEDPVA